jgi:hypothetical protein
MHNEEYNRDANARVGDVERRPGMRERHVKIE